MKEDLMTLALLKWLIGITAVCLVMLAAYFAYGITMAGN
jgi:hypothetical protein